MEDYSVGSEGVHIPLVIRDFTSVYTRKKDDFSFDLDLEPEEYEIHRFKAIEFGNGWIISPVTISHPGASTLYKLIKEEDESGILIKVNHPKWFDSKWLVKQYCLKRGYGRPVNYLCSSAVELKGSGLKFQKYSDFAYLKIDSEEEVSSDFIYVDENSRLIFNFIIFQD